MPPDRSYSNAIDAHNVAKNGILTEPPTTQQHNHQKSLYDPAPAMVDNAVRHQGKNRASTVSNAGFEVEIENKGGMSSTSENPIQQFETWKLAITNLNPLLAKVKISPTDGSAIQSGC